MLAFAPNFALRWSPQALREKIGLPREPTLPAAFADKEFDDGEFDGLRLLIGVLGDTHHV